MALKAAQSMQVGAVPCSMSAPEAHNCFSSPVAGKLPQPVEHGPALAVQLLDGQQGELPVLRIDPALGGKG